MQANSDGTIYSTIKIGLKAILQNSTNHATITSLVIDLSQLVEQSYQFIRLYCCSKFHKKQVLPIIDKAFIMNVFRTLGTKTQTVGRKSKNQQLLAELATFHQTEFIVTYSNFRSVDLTNKTQACDYLATGMLTSYENNIKLHFVKRLAKTIKMLYSDVEANKRWKYVDFLLGDPQSSPLPADHFAFLLFHQDFIEQLPYSALRDSPPSSNDSLPYYLAKKPMQFLMATLWLAQQCELEGAKIFQALPLKRSPLHITLDTACLMNLFVKDGIKNMKNHINEHKDPLWRKYFNILDNKKLRKKRHSFSYMIRTDGVTACILFKKIHTNTVSKSKTKSKIDSRPKPSIELISPDRILVGCDPGRRNLVFMTDGEQTFRYSAPQRRVETYQKRSRQIIEKEKKRADIVQQETKLSNYNSKTTDPERFKQYLMQRHQVDLMVRDFYKAPLLRKLRWRRYVHTQQSEAKMLNRIANTFGEDCVIGYGDWSGSNHLKYQAPSPNKRFRKLIDRRFETYDIDEYKTSATCHNCLSPTEKFEKRPSPRPWRKSSKVFRNTDHSVMILVHGLLRCTNGNCGTHWNRDLNASLNIRFCLIELMVNKRQPLPFRRISQSGSATVKVFSVSTSP
jgi:transposase